MIRLQDICQRLSEVKGRIEQKVLHPYLIKFIKTPYIDEDKLLLLITIMDQLELSDKQRENYALATMLIQIALDTHEQISNEKINGIPQITSRQLTVLAGDYYSGLYYKLLADSEDIFMINVLAGGIKEVNEHKISVFQQEFDGIEKLMASIKIIESSLITKIIDYFHVNVWYEIVSNLLLVKRLLSEKNRYSQTGCSQLFEAMKKIVFAKSESKMKDLSSEQQNYLFVICDRYIEFSRTIIESCLQKLPRISEQLDLRITSILNQHQPIAKTFVEEG
ncbi:heptaprenyl diphosphate synthase component 1 [Neobacillus sp. PS3-12]|uniref:heptaprenyl diphosphate synthase component 1 n=1 Tax=Neobacillus sp. PS3-12 TaxID=3070677 RepID=UPI0027DFEF78|nr:heptaprenyl diphosphate synthase component 1 [Neobacillus sp. PS3-12]WML53894.1 heptaprenyl diphosphate synthase component 1 [Neobacillus sp. PS3-12]